MIAVPCAAIHINLHLVQNTHVFLNVNIPKIAPAAIWGPSGERWCCLYKALPNETPKFVKSQGAFSLHTSPTFYPPAKDQPCIMYPVSYTLNLPAWDKGCICTRHAAHLHAHCPSDVASVDPDLKAGRNNDAQHRHEPDCHL